MQLQITEIDDAEIPAVVALWGRCNLIRPWNDPIDDIRIARDSGHGAVLVARDGDTVVGAAMTGHDGHRGAIYYLAVDPAARRGGLGRALVAACEAWCRARGVPKVNLLVRKENLGVLAFYEAIGYRDTNAVCLYHNLDAEAGARELEMKAAWAERLARAE